MTARKQSMWLLLKMYLNNTVFTVLSQGSSLGLSFSIIDSFSMNYMPYTCEQWLNDPLALTKMSTHWTKQRSNTAFFFLKKRHCKRVFLCKWKSDNSRALFSLKQWSKWFSVTGLRGRNRTQVSSRCLLSWQLLFSSFSLNDQFFLLGNQQLNKERLF